jgi:hypothetical protein
MVHSEQNPTLAAHLDGELDRADETPNAGSGARASAAEAWI